MMKPDGHPDFPVWKLERYLLGELPASEMERIDARRKTDAELAEWIEAVRAEHRDLADMHPTGRAAGRIWNRLREDRAEERGLRAPAWLGPRVWVPAFGILMLSVLLPLNFNSWTRRHADSADGIEETRIKGLEPSLYLYRKAGDSAEALQGGDRVRQGDLIQAYYEAAGRGYGAIYSVDREGNVTWHLPDDGSHSAALKKGRVPLQFAFELDSLPGFERFVFLSSEKPFRPDSLAQREIRGKALPAGVSRRSIPLVKLVKEPRS
jgi:hypothetical protein